MVDGTDFQTYEKSEVVLFGAHTIYRDAERKLRVPARIGVRY